MSASRSPARWGGNAGGEWVDEEVVVDGHLITSRNPGDLPAFTEALLTALG